VLGAGTRDNSVSISTATAPVVRAIRFRSSLESIIANSQKIGEMDREICERIKRPAQVSSREISREQEITDT